MEKNDEIIWVEVTEVLSGDTYKLWHEDGKMLVWHRGKRRVFPAEGIVRAAGPSLCKGQKGITVPVTRTSGEKGVVEMMRRGTYHHGQETGGF